MSEYALPFINQLKLDAMKKGMIRAAEELNKNHDKCHCMECGKEELDEIQIILAAAEQLTEKDLD